MDAGIQARERGFLRHRTELLRVPWEEAGEQFAGSAREGRVTRGVAREVRRRDDRDDSRVRLHGTDIPIGEFCVPAGDRRVGNGRTEEPQYAGGDRRAELVASD